LLLRDRKMYIKMVEICNKRFTVNANIEQEIEVNL